MDENHQDKTGRKQMFSPKKANQPLVVVGIGAALVGVIVLIIDLYFGSNWPLGISILQVLIISLVLIGIGLMILLIRVGYTTQWVGFKGKTLWEWLQLLIIPLVLAVGGYAYSSGQHYADQQRAVKQEQASQERALAQQRETTLQTYLDNMSDLLLKENLAKPQPGEEVRQMARQRTLTTLRRLDAKRNGIVLQFLQDAHLIGLQNAIIDLRNADLSNDDLSGTNLRGCNLSGAFLFDANLSRAFLFGANLSGASLYHATLSKANLGEADLSGAFLFGANLSGAGLYHATLGKAKLGEADLSGVDLSGANLSRVNLDKTKLEGAHYNTEEIPIRNSQGEVVVQFPPTQWPPGFDPKAAGATEVNTYPVYQ